MANLERGLASKILLAGGDEDAGKRFATVVFKQSRC